MQIIPVIDLLDGTVVRGIGGDRSHYKPIKSVLCASSDPIELVHSILRFHEFEILYLADLNALQGFGHSKLIINTLVAEFPTTEFWVDGGIKSVEDLSQYPDADTLIPIIATECMESIAQYETLRTYLRARRHLLSLDHKYGELGPAELFSSVDLWPREVIIMSLNHVGRDNGPDLPLLQKYQTQSRSTDFMAAGGVRSMEDLRLLMNNGIAGALIASALHSGKITKEHLTAIYTKKCPAMRGI